ncbi:14028_t:CDS:2 [Acaulospora colombiana]|uniref:14028_t:CDS:1 n=1 Tax=Acaulospora colombiana TaxID=27376 RepID=A0ACA9MD14_9GLOM|nr:14028_t:CDS:2 [Acaulospora colombiana]
MLPVELQQWILRYAVAAPEFLDPNYWVDDYPPWVIMERVDCGRDFEGYLKVEENINSLRRVCRLWDEYLRKYTHRFVHMSDIVHGGSVSAVRDDPYLQYCYETLGQNQLPKVEVLDLNIGEYVDKFILPHICPNLARITGNDFIGAIEFGVEAYRSATLTTLTLDFTPPDPSFASVLDNVYLPALRNLWVLDAYYGGLYTYDEPAWLPLIRALGKELRRVEDLCYDGGMPSGPPDGHPLHTISLNDSWILIRDTFYPWSKFVPQWQLDWPGLRTFRVNEVWDTSKGFPQRMRKSNLWARSSWRTLGANHVQITSRGWGLKRRKSGGSGELSTNSRSSAAVLAFAFLTVEGSSGLSRHWANNGDNQNPCQIWQALGQKCDASFTVTALEPGTAANGFNSTFYPAPTGSGANNCQCSHIAYSLMAACSWCQEGVYSIDGWLGESDWQANCGSNYNSQGISSVDTSGINIPPYATQPVPGPVWDPTDAQAAQVRLGSNGNANGSTGNGNNNNNGNSSSNAALTRSIGVVLLPSPTSCSNVMVTSHTMGSMAALCPSSPCRLDPRVPSSSTDAVDPNATITFYNGTILTLANDAYSPVEALVVQGQKIKFTGALDTARQIAGPNAQSVDLQGRCVLPGFIEPHLHLALTALADHWLLSLSPMTTTTLDQAVAKIRAKAQDLALKDKEGKWLWVAGYGYDPSRIKCHRDLHVTDLDPHDVAYGHPVFILNQSGHVAYVNSKAFELAGVTVDSIKGDKQYEVVDGKLTGVIFEQAVGAIGQLVNKPSPEQMVEFGIETVKKWAKKGCTTVFDAGIGGSGPNEVSFIQAVFKNPMPLRFYGALSIYVATPPLIPIIKERPIQLGNATVTAIKYWVDGSTQGFTAALNKPYLCPPPHWPECGTLNYKHDEELQQVMEPWLRAGWQLLVHANGDRAVDQALNVYDAIFKNNPNRDQSIMHRIEHFTVAEQAQRDRAKELGLGISHTIGHVRYWGPTFCDYVLGKERAMMIDAVKSDEATGLVFSFHSDSPLTEVSPLEYLRIAVTRHMYPDEKGVLNEGECVDLWTALKGVTINPARQIGIADCVGTLEVGKDADLVILDKDLRSVDPEMLGSLKACSSDGYISTSDPVEEWGTISQPRSWYDPAMSPGFRHPWRDKPYVHLE